MPVILDPGSDDIKTWLDPGRYEWSRELQSLLTPYSGALEVYPVSKEVGKVGNNSPRFIRPLDSKENKSNIANFFAKGQQTPGNLTKGEEGKGIIEHHAGGDKVVHDAGEDNHRGVKRKHEENYSATPLKRMAAGKQKISATKNTKGAVESKKKPNSKITSFFPS